MGKLKKVIMHNEKHSRTVTVSANTDKEAIVKANKKAGWNAPGLGPWKNYSVSPKKRFVLF